MYLLGILTYISSINLVVLIPRYQLSVTKRSSGISYLQFLYSFQCSVKTWWRKRTRATRAAPRAPRLCIFTTRASRRLSSSPVPNLVPTTCNPRDVKPPRNQCRYAHQRNVNDFCSRVFTVFCSFSHLFLSSIDNMVSNRGTHVLVWEQPGLEDQRPKTYSGESEWRHWKILGLASRSFVNILFFILFPVVKIIMTS